MRKQKLKIKENRFTEFMMLSILSFSIVISILDLFSIEPKLTSVTLYGLLFIVLLSIYKPFRLVTLNLIKMTFSFMRFRSIRK